MLYNEIRERVESGVVPSTFKYNLNEIIRALFRTRPANTFEMFGFLSAKLRKAESGNVLDYGLLSCQKVTQAFAEYLADSMTASGSYPIDAFDYHGHGTSATAEANTQTALVAEVDTRATGTPTNPTAYVYRSVGTITFAAANTINEHGIFSASTSGTMLDRSVLSTPVTGAINDTVEYTYNLTINAEA